MSKPRGVSFGDGLKPGGISFAEEPKDPPPPPMVQYGIDAAEGEEQGEQNRGVSFAEGEITAL